VHSAQVRGPGGKSGAPAGIARTPMTTPHRSRLSQPIVATLTARRAPRTAGHVRTGGHAAASAWTASAVARTVAPGAPVTTRLTTASAVVRTTVRTGRLRR